MKPGTRAVLELLEARGSMGVTPLVALHEVGCFRLGARIWELKRDGYDIASELVMTANGKHVARYWLREKAA